MSSTKSILITSCSTHTLRKTPNQPACDIMIHKYNVEEEISPAFQCEAIIHTKICTSNEQCFKWETMQKIQHNLRKPSAPIRIL